MAARKSADPMLGRRKGKQEKKKRLTKNDVDSDDESVVSVRTSSSEDIGDESGFKAASDTSFADTIEQLTEKRASTRISALKSVIKSLTSQLMDEELPSRLTTLSMYLTNIIRKGSPDEVTLACRILSLVFLTLGSESEEAGKSFISVLSTVIKNSAKSPSSRKACIQALGTLHFILSSPQDMEESMQLLEQTFLDTKIDPTISAQAVTIWSLLASTISTLDLGTSLYAKYLPLFTKLLEHKDLEVRSASGEAIALLYSAALNVELMDEDEKEGQESKYKPDLASLTDLLKSLATEGSKKIAKQDKVRQRSVFRDVVATVEDGIDPTEKITIGKQKHEFVGWAKIKQLALVREILGTGFALHFAQNDLLSDIFEVQKQEDTETPKKDKKLDRAMRQEKEKNSRLEIGKQRKKKNAFQEELLNNE